MQKKELLLKYLDIASNNLLCYSNNYLMTEAKEGFEKEWQEENEEIELLGKMIKDTEKETALSDCQQSQQFYTRDEINKLCESLAKGLDRVFEGAIRDILAQADNMRLNSSYTGDKRSEKYCISSVEKLKCYDDVLRMLVSRKFTLPEIIVFIESQGERCSKSALDRYRNQKLKISRIKDDGSYEVTEKSGRIVKFIANCNDRTIYKIGD